MSVFSHRSLLFKNRWNIFYGGLSLVIVDFLTLLNPILTKVVMDRIQGSATPSWIPEKLKQLDDLTFLIVILSAFLVCVFIAVVGRFLWRAFMVWRMFPFIHEMRCSLFQHLMRLSWQKLRSRKVGDLISALSEDVENVRLTTSLGTLAIVDTIINFCIFPAILWYLAPSLAMVILPPLFILPALFVLLSQRWDSLYDRVQNQIGELSAKAFEIAAGIKVIKAFGREEAIRDDFHHASEQLREASLKVAPYQASFGAFLQLVLGLATFSSLIYGAHLISKNELALSNFVAFVLFLSHLDWPLTAVAWFTEFYRRSSASLKRIQKIEALETMPKERLISFSPRYELNDMELTNDRGQRILTIPKWTAGPGERWAVTGSVGSGKTVFLEHLSGIRRGSRGTSRVGELDLNLVSQEELSKKVLFLPQEAFIMTRSLRQNLLLGEPDVSDEILWEHLLALKFSKTEWDSRGGLWARLGERGANLSGGQRQRAALVRGLIRSRSVYLWDDVLSHLDSATEQVAFDYLMNQVPANALVVAATQRWSLMVRMQNVLVLQGGRVEYCGPTENAHEHSPFIRQLRELQAA